MRLSGTKTGSANQYNGLGDQLYDLGGARPTLDLNFASNGSLVDSVTGKTLVTHTRASNATYVDGDGIIKDAVTNLAPYSQDATQWVTTDSTVTNTTVEAPDNSLTAISFEEDLVTAPHQARTFTTGAPAVLANTQYTMSVFAKAGVRDYITLLATSGKYGGNTVKQTFNIANGTLADGLNEVDDAVITAVGNGWYRCSMTFTSGSTVSGTVRVEVLTNDSTDTSNNKAGISGVACYLWGAQLEQSSTAGEYVKTTSTINSAPRFDHKVTRTTTNLLTYSEEHNTASSYAGLELFGVGSVADALQAPDGTITADKITEDTSSGFHRTGKNFSHKNGETYTYSVFLKAGTRKKAHLQLSSNLFTIAFFDLEAGTSGAGGTIQDVGNGWFRCSISNTATADGTAEGRVEITDDDNKRNYVGDGESFLYVWGAQVEANADVGPYVKTEASIATKVDAEPLGLLVEESRENLTLYSQDFTVNNLSTGWRTDPGYSRATLVANTGIDDPSGGSTASRWSSGTTNAEELIYHVTPAAMTAGNTYTASVWIRRVTQTGPVELIIGDLTAYDVSSQLDAVPFGQWVRVTATRTITSTAVTRAYIAVKPNGSSPTTIDIWGYQIEAGSFPTSYIRTSGSTVTRSADVTSIEGNDFGTFNLLEYSEDGTQSSWTKNNSTITPDTTAAPNGTLTADKITPNNGSSAGDAYLQAYTITANAVSTVSGYFKAGGFEAVQLGTSQGGNGFFATYNLTTGAKISSGPIGTGTLTAESIESVGNGWYRISASGTITAGSTAGAWRITIKNASGATVTGDGTSGIYVWGAQAEQSSTATPYVKSDVTFTSRGSTATYYDYNGIIRTAAVDEARNVAFLPDGSGNFVSAGELLLEDAGTNLVKYSEEFDNGYWVKSGSTLTANNTTSPDGTQTADFLQESSGNSRHDLFLNTLATLTAQPHTFSLYAKANGRNWIKLRFSNVGTFEGVYFNLTGDGAVGTADTGYSGSITNVGNGWYRCQVTFTTGAGNYHAAPRLADADGSDEYQGDGASGVYIWGAQLEANSYATSYIPTYGSTATRAADVSSSSSNTFGNSFYNQTEGVLFANSQTPAPTSSYDAVATIGSSSVFLIVSLQRNGADSRGFGANATGSTGSGTNSYPVNTFVKQALAAKQNDFAFSTDGSSINADTSTDPLTAAKHMYIGSNAGDYGSLLTSHIKRITYWPTRLSNDTLETITV